jgi:hypothetical protein
MGVDRRIRTFQSIRNALAQVLKLLGTLLRGALVIYSDKQNSGPPNRSRVGKGDGDLEPLSFLISWLPFHKIVLIAAKPEDKALW